MTDLNPSRVKEVLRQQLRESRVRYHQSVKAEDVAAALLAQVLALDIIQSTDVIAGYAPMGSEIDDFPLLTYFYECGHVIALPVISDDHGVLSFASWTPGDALVSGPYGTRCPPVNNATFVIPTCLFVPLLGVDSAKYRLGQGGGYYDRTIAALRHQNPAIKTIGLAYPCQYIPEIPIEPHDQKLDFVVFS